MANSNVFGIVKDIKINGKSAAKLPSQEERSKTIESIGIIFRRSK